MWLSPRDKRELFTARDRLVTALIRRGDPGAIAMANYLASLRKPKDIVRAVPMVQAFIKGR